MGLTFTQCKQLKANGYNLHDFMSTLKNKPDWIEYEFNIADLHAIQQGGCASGAYMPAVTYSIAAETMAEHGDDVLDFIQDHLGELPQPPADESWSGLAVFYLSLAVELWAAGFDLDHVDWD